MPNQFQEHNKTKKKKAKKKSGMIKSFNALLNGEIVLQDFVLRNLPFLLFGSFLVILYIAYGYWTNDVLGDVKRLEKQVGEHKAEEIALKRELNLLSLESKVEQRLKEQGLIGSMDPLNKIAADKDE